MDHAFQAIYEDGVLRPLEPLRLLNRQIVTLSLVEDSAAMPSDQTAANIDSATIEQQTQAWMAFVERVEALPVARPDDGFSNRAHDAAIYGD